MSGSRPPTGRTAAAVRAAVLAAGLAAATAAAAASLGALTAQSIRDEPLRAVVELAGHRGAAPADVRIAGAAVYDALGFVRDPALGAATASVTTEPDGKRFVVLATDAPVAADELVLVLEADGGAERRVYRLRLGSDEPADRVNVRGVEPIGWRGGAPVPATAVPVAAAAASGLRGGGSPTPAVDARSVAAAGAPRADAGGAPSAGAGTAPSPGAARVAAPGPGGPAAAGDAARPADDAPAVPIAPPARPSGLTVRDGDDLESIARALRPAGATLEQSAIALWRDNRAAFAGRPPRPRVGATLAVPDEARVLAVDPVEARRLVAALATPAPAPAGGAAATGPGGEAAPVAASRASSAPDRGPAVAARPGPADRAPRAPSATGRTDVAQPPTPRTAGRDAAPGTAPAVARAPGTAPGPASAPGPAARPAAAVDADAAFDAAVADTLRRARALQQRLASLRGELEAATGRQEALLRELVERERGRAAARPAAPPTR